MAEHGSVGTTEVKTPEMKRIANACVLVEVFKQHTQVVTDKPMRCATAFVEPVLDDDRANVF